MLTHWNDEAANLLEQLALQIAYVADRDAVEAWDCTAMEISVPGTTSGSTKAACEYFYSTPSNVKVVYEPESDGQAVLLRDPGSDTTVIAFRGSGSLTNWLTNLNVVSENRDGMSVHAGFDDAAAALQPCILNYLQEHHGKRSTLMVTGHSLGGALATLTAHELRSQGHVTGPIALVSFASPRVGFGQFRDHFASQFPQGAWRVTRPDDVVTNVPPYVPFLWPWVHVPGEIYFSQQNGASRRCCDDASWEDGRCAASSNQILETGDQHLSFPYMVTGCAAALLHPHMIRLAQFYSVHALAVTTWCLPGARVSRCSAARTTASSRHRHLLLFAPNSIPSAT